jgi:hypothetical protein
VRRVLGLTTHSHSSPKSDTPAHIACKRLKSPIPEHRTLYAYVRIFYATHGLDRLICYHFQFLTRMLVYFANAGTRLIRPFGGEAQNVRETQHTLSTDAGRKTGEMRRPPAKVCSLSGVVWSDMFV